MAAEATIRAWGNSQGIIIPKDILKKMGLSISDKLSIETKNNEIILKKEFRHKTLEERAAEYGGKIDVYEFDWGEPVGREML